MQMEKITPASLAEFWAKTHFYGADMQTALSHLPNIEALLPQPTGKQPTIIHMLGSPGSGKSVVAKALLRRLEKAGQTFYRHDSDSVMEALPPYHADREAMGAEIAFLRWELPARAASYALLENIVAGQVSVLFDHGASDRRHINLLLGIQQRGYRVFMVNPVVTLETALQRVTERMRKPNGRYTPEQMVRERHATLAILADEYARRFEVLRVDNNNTLDEAAINTIALHISG